MSSDMRAMMLICIALLGVAGLGIAVWDKFRTDRTSPSEPIEFCLVSETEGEGLRRVSFASGDQFFIEAPSFTEREVDRIRYREFIGTGEYEQITTRIVAEDGTNVVTVSSVPIDAENIRGAVRLRFLRPEQGDEFTEKNLGRSLAVVLPGSQAVVRGRIVATMYPGAMPFTHDPLSDIERRALGSGIWQDDFSVWNPRRIDRDGGLFEFCLVQESPTDITRTVSDLARKPVHVEPVSFTNGGQFFQILEDLDDTQHRIHCMQFNDPGISNMQEFVAKNSGRQLALVCQDVAVFFIPVRDHLPGEFYLEGISEQENADWESEWKWKGSNFWQTETVRAPARPPIEYCLVGEDGGDGTRRVSLPSGEELSIEVSSFTGKDVSGYEHYSGARGQGYQTLIPGLPLQFRPNSRVPFRGELWKGEDFIVEHLGRTLAVVLPLNDVVLRGRIADGLPDRIIFARSRQDEFDQELLRGDEYCLVRQSPTDNTRTVPDLGGNSVHVEPASFTRKDMGAHGLWKIGIDQVLYALYDIRFSDPEISTAQEFLTKNRGRQLAVVRNEIVVLLIPIKRQVPGEFFLEGISEEEYELWKAESKGKILEKSGR